MAFPGAERIPPEGAGRAGAHLPSPSGHRRSEADQEGHFHYVAGLNKRLWLPSSFSVTAALREPSDSGTLEERLSDIYSDNVLEFSVGAGTVEIRPTAGVRQGDPLSSVIFNIAEEPVIRSAKTQRNDGYDAFGANVRTTAFADDIAVVGSCPSRQQMVLTDVESAAGGLGLSFNPSKCVSLVLRGGGRAVPAGVLELTGRRVRALADGEHEEYLGVPIGAKFLFRLPSDLPGLLAKVEDSGLAPWQQLEVYRSALLPSLSHHLSSGKVSKDSISHLITRCQDFMRKTANVPMPANTAFFYSDRRTGGLGSQNLSEEADIWTLSTAVQLLESSDHAVRDISAAQLEQTVVAAIEIFSQVRNQQQQVAELVRQQDATTESQVRFQAWAVLLCQFLNF